MQDFAGSTAVHLIGATGAFAALLLLGPAEGQVRAGWQAARDPGAQHAAVRARRADPVAGVVRIQPGLDPERARRALRRDPVHHQPRRRRGRSHRGGDRRTEDQGIDIGMAGNGAIAALVAITAPSGYVEIWAAPIIGAVAGVIVVLGVYAIDKLIDDPVGALSAHGLAGIWGTVSCGMFTAPRLAQYNGVRRPGGRPRGTRGSIRAADRPGGRVHDRVLVRVLDELRDVLRDQEDIGLRVTEAEEDAGLDISEHGMYGYPEQFIPSPEYPGAARAAAARGQARDRRPVTASGRPRGRSEQMKKIKHTSATRRSSRSGPSCSTRDFHPCRSAR